jgi:serine/threonine protein kinase
MTGVGVLLGTAAYMSPEQAKGRPADKRSDIWAFGCVLYEMLTGRRVFDGDDVADTLANVLNAQPHWVAFPSDVPESIDMLVRRCLEKDRGRPVADLSIALFLINEPSIARSEANRVDERSSTWRRAAFLGLAALLVAVTSLVRRYRVWEIGPCRTIARQKFAA